MAKCPAIESRQPPTVAPKCHMAGPVAQVPLHAIVRSSIPKCSDTDSRVTTLEMQRPSSRYAHIYLHTHTHGETAIAQVLSKYHEAIYTALGPCTRCKIERRSNPQLGITSLSDLSSLLQRLIRLLLLRLGCILLSLRSRDPAIERS